MDQRNDPNCIAFDAKIKALRKTAQPNPPDSDVSPRKPLRIFHCERERVFCLLKKSIGDCRIFFAIEKRGFLDVAIKQRVFSNSVQSKVLFAIRRTIPELLGQPGSGSLLTPEIAAKSRLSLRRKSGRHPVDRESQLRVGKTSGRTRFAVREGVPSTSTEVAQCS
jgi:hypothetical protein